MNNIETSITNILDQNALLNVHDLVAEVYSELEDTAVVDIKICLLKMAEDDILGFDDSWRVFKK